MDLLEIELYREMCSSCYGDHYDDCGIDEIVWSEIKSSTSKADFICYLLHSLQKARHKGDAWSRIKIMSGEAVGIPTGYRRVAQHIRGLALEGDETAMFHMGKMHALGIGIDKDWQLARSWYQEAIEADETRAYCDLGWLYLHGCSGIAKNKGEAFRLLIVGAQRGVPAAHASIGMMLLTGDGIPINTRLGLHMLHVAFDAGYNNAGNFLADVYFAGTHLKRDINLAHDWLVRVAARGDARTMAILGHYLITGSHGKQDVAQGLALLQDSINKEYIFAYLWMGTLYKDGKGVERDIGKAMEYFKRGATAGDKRCGQALMDLMPKTESARPSAVAPLAGP